MSRIFSVVVSVWLLFAAVSVPALLVVPVRAGLGVLMVGLYAAGVPAQFLGPPAACLGVRVACVQGLAFGGALIRRRTSVSLLPRGSLRGALKFVSARCLLPPGVGHGLLRLDLFALAGC
ncbi:hypothetical protein ACIPVK_21510 [Paeniglutamicibacter sp. MACA_103]|uniref:hypothetical protein n=1 Tax=Paeniglutamicibacter sp. MACA_103 TaxID=3377337 RepID=UPI0038931609